MDGGASFRYIIGNMDGWMDEWMEDTTFVGTRVHELG